MFNIDEEVYTISGAGNNSCTVRKGEVVSITQSYEGYQYKIVHGEEGARHELHLNYREAEVFKLDSWDMVMTVVKDIVL